MKMAARSGYVRWVFWVINTLFMLFGACLLGFLIYNAASMSNLATLLDGSYLFTYGTLVLSLIMVVTGVFGTLAAVTENICALKLYFYLMLLLIGLEIAVVVATYVFREDIPDVIQSAWDSFAQETRYQIQQDLKCCAFDDILIEYPTTVPESCYTTGSSSTGTLFVNKCGAEMVSWLESNNPTWVGTLGGLAALQLLCGILSCMVMTRIHENIRTEPDPRDLEDEIKLPPPETPKKLLQPKTFGKPPTRRNESAVRDGLTASTAR